MRFKKTRSDNRGTYTFRFSDGTSVTLRPGEDGVTEADIRVLHSLDDAEVYSNIKNSRPPMTGARKRQKRNGRQLTPANGILQTGTSPLTTSQAMTTKTARTRAGFLPRPQRRRILKTRPRMR